MEGKKTSAQYFDIRYDILRSIALVAVILAHVNPPEYIFQLRNFDVPLLVLVAGSVFSLSQSRAGYGYVSYLKARFVRLLVPTWSFYIFLFAFTYLIVLIMQVKYPFSLHYIFNAFILKGRYVWIIKVFLLIALISIPLLNFYRRNNSLKKSGMFIIGAYTLYEFLFLVYKSTGIFAIDTFIKDYLFYLLPYACIFSLGILLKDSGRKITLGIAFVSYAVFTATFFILNYRPTQLYKYPPRLYYLSYALAVSCLLYYVAYNLKINILWIRRIIQFISRNSLWIYLWHIFAIQCWGFITNYIALPEFWIFKFILVFSITSLVVFLQNIILMNACQKIQRK